MSSTTFQELTALSYCSTNKLRGLELNIAVNMRECYKLNYFWTNLLYNAITMRGENSNLLNITNILRIGSVVESFLLQ
jgi:hypothetical protein